jgi:cytochrome b561
MQTTRYSRTARLFHWSMAVLILLTIPVGLVMVQPGLGRGLQNGLFLYHKNVGVLLLVLVAARLIWRVRRPAPEMPASIPDWQARVARLTHGLMYGLLFIVPVAGYIRVRAGGFPIESLDAMGLPGLIPKSEALAGLAKSVHYYAALAFCLVVLLHIAAALYHRFRLRDGVFARMWPPFGRS